MTDAVGRPRRRKSTLREEQKKATRTMLLDAARKSFRARGYAAVTVDDITAEVGCSRATFYLHFPAKLDILRELSDGGFVPSILAIYQDLDRVLETGSRAEFAAWIGRAIEWFQEYRDMLQAWDEATVLEPDFAEIARAGMTALPNAMTNYLARWPEQGRDEARLRIELLSAQIERFFTRWVVQGTIEIEAERAVEVLTDIWFPALAAPTAR